MSDRYTLQQFRDLMAKRHGKGYKNANDLTRAILDYLNSSGFYAWRNNSGVVFDVRQAAGKMLSLFAAFVLAKKKPVLKDVEASLRKCFRKGSGQEGESDILGVEKATGRFVAVEVKHGKDQLSPAQVYFLDRIRQGGGHALAAGSLAEVVEYFERKKQQHESRPTPGGSSGTTEDAGDSARAV